MKNCIKIFLFVWMFFIVRFLAAQNLNVDSLKTELKKEKNDTVKCNILSALSELTPDDEWPKYNSELQLLAEKKINDPKISSTQKIFYLRKLASSLNNSGLLASKAGDKEQALRLHDSALKICETINEKHIMAYAFVHLALIYKNEGDIRKALDMNEKALKIRIAIGDKKGIATSLNNIGLIYKGQNDLPNALDYYIKALKIQEEIGNKRGASSLLLNIGMIYRDKKNFIKAEEYLRLAIKIKEELNDISGLAASYNNMGLICSDQKDYVRALSNFDKAIELREKLNDKKGKAATLSHIVNVYLLQKNYSKALKYGLIDMQLSRELGYPEYISKVAHHLTSVYKATGNNKLALENFELYIQMRDSISNQETKKASIKTQLKYEYEKKAAADSVKNAEQQKVTNAQLEAQTASLKQEKFQRYSLAVGLLVVLVGLGFVINRFRITQKQKKIIEEQKIKVDEAFEKLHEKNKEVMDSIRYAKRIQTALLTSEKYIERKLIEIYKN